MDFIQTLLGGAVGAAIASGLFLLINTLVSKKFKSPADATEETRLLLEFYRDSREDAVKDRETLEATIGSLNETIGQLRLADTENWEQKRNLQGRIFELESRVHDLELRLTEKDELLKKRERELAQYVTAKAGLGDLEDTITH